MITIGVAADHTACRSRTWPAAPPRPRRHPHTHREPHL